jgi:hypothetical protein
MLKPSSTAISEVVCQEPLEAPHNERHDVSSIEKETGRSTTSSGQSGSDHDGADTSRDGMRYYVQLVRHANWDGVLRGFLEFTEPS